MSNIVIRTFEEADRARILDIAEAGWRPIYVTFREIMGEKLFAALYPDWAQRKRDQVAAACVGDHDAHARVAEIDGAVVGFVTYCFTEAEVGEIGLNAVDPAYQKRGVASALYRAALDDMKAAGMVHARVTTGGDPSHAPARAAYAKAGFDIALPAVTYYRKL